MDLATLETKKNEIDKERSEPEQQIDNLENKARELSASEVLDGENLTTEIQTVAGKLKEKEDKLSRLNFALEELSRRIEIAGKADKEKQLQDLMLQYSSLGSEGKKLIEKFRQLSEQLVQAKASLNELSQRQQSIKQRGEILAKELGVSFVLPQGQGLKIQLPNKSDLELARRTLA